MYCTRLCPDQVNMADLEQFLLQNDFAEDCRLLYAVAGRSFLSMNDLVNSLSFYAESKNAPRVFSIVLKFLESKPKLIDYENILSLINASTLVSYDALVFLSRYRDFLKFLEEGSFKEAGDYITNLFFSGSIPSQFWKFVYGDIELLLDSASIDAPGCLELLRILQDEDVNPVINRIQSKLIHQLSISWK